MKTPTALAGVRGTGFEATPSSFSVVEGTIAVTAGGVEVVIETGMMTSIPESGAPPTAPSSIPPAQLEELKSTNVATGEVAETVQAETQAAVEAISEKKEEVDEVVESVDEDVQQTTIDDQLVNDAESAGFDEGTGGVQGTIQF